MLRGFEWFLGLSESGQNCKLRITSNNYLRFNTGATIAPVFDLEKLLCTSVYL